VAHAAATNLAPASAGKSKVGKLLGIVAWVMLVAMGVAFVLKYVDEADFRVYRRNKREVIPTICPPN
jgi:hypothetical protein